MKFSKKFGIVAMMLAMVFVVSCSNDSNGSDDNNGESSSANYTVEHWKENLDGSGYTKVDADTETKQGMAGSNTQAVAKDYEGFTAQTVTQAAIKADGSTVVQVKYDRKTYTLTFKANGGNWEGSTADKTVSGKYEAAVTAPTNPTNEGKYFVDWDKPVPSTFTADDIFTATWSNVQPVNYTVEHWKENLDGSGYTRLDADTETKQGVAGSKTQAVAKDYEGFTAQTVTQTAIAADGSTVAQIKYDRKTYTLTFKANGGNWEGSTADKTVSGKYEATVPETEIPANPTKNGGIFDSWDKPIPATFTANDTFTATWIPVVDYHLISNVEQLNSAPTEKWIGACNASTSYDENNKVTIYDGLLTVESTDKETHACWVLPETLTSGVYEISADVNIVRSPTTLGYTFIQLLNPEAREFAGVRMLENGSGISLRTDGGNVANEKAQPEIGKETHILITVNFDKKVVYAKFGETELPPRSYTIDGGLKVIKISASSKGATVTVKNLKITEKKADPTKPALGIGVTLNPTSQSDIGKLTYTSTSDKITLTVPNVYTTYSWRVDGDLKSEATTNVLEITKSSLSWGKHSVMLTVDGKYSATYILEKE